MNALSPQFLEVLAWTLIHFLWQGLVIGAVAAVALRSLRKSKPQARYSAALIAFVACIAAPVITFAFLWAQFSDQANWAAVGGGTVSGALDYARQQGYPAWLLKIWPSLPSVLVAGWSAGVVIGGLKLLAGFIGVQWVRRHGVEQVPLRLQKLFDELCEEFDLAGRASLRISNRILSPMVVGWLRPLVLVPASAWLGLSQEELRLILAHELAHIRRWDYLVNLLQQVVVTILFYHPIVHWLSRVLSEEREMCCDEMVVGCSEAKRLAYAKALLHLQEQHSHMMRLAMSARGGPFLRRVYRLLGKQEDREAPQTAVNGLVGLLMVSVVNLVFMLHTSDAVANLSHGMVPQQASGLTTFGLVDHPMDEVLADVRSSWETALERQALDLGPPIRATQPQPVAHQNTEKSGQRSSQTAPVYQLPALQALALPVRFHDAETEQGPSFDVAAAKALVREELFDTPARPQGEFASLGQDPELAIDAVKTPLAALERSQASRENAGRKAAKVTPRLVRMVQPNYPSIARTDGARGDVRLIYRLYPDGRVRDIQAEPGNDAHPALVKAAIEALSSWEYEPFNYNRPLVMAQTFRFLRKEGTSDSCFSRLKDQCARGQKAMDSIMVNDGLSSTGMKEMAAEAAEKWARRT